MNLTAHPEDPEEIAFHVIDSVMPVALANDEVGHLSARFASDQRVVDLGSGAGFPGLVLAAASDAHFTLVESRRKRASFLQVASAEMGLDNVVIEAGRAEEIDPTRRFDLATSRAFGDPMEFFGLASRLLMPGGLAMLYASSSQRFAVEVTRIPYQVERRGQRVERILALRRQA
jgi:16S rRNA (guanine527-N7)-methyltransferase